VASTTRLLLLDVPTMLADILKHALLQQKEWLIQEAHYDSATTDTGSLAPHVVVVGSRVRSSRQRATRLLALWPAARIVIVTDGGRHSVWYELAPRETELGEISLRELVRLLQRAMRSADRRPEKRRILRH
jgi:hypothetical protein